MKVTCCRDDVERPDSDMVLLPPGLGQHLTIMLDGEDVTGVCRWVDWETGEGFLYTHDERGRAVVLWDVVRRGRLVDEIQGRFVRGLTVVVAPEAQQVYDSMLAGYRAGWQSVLAGEGARL